MPRVTPPRGRPPARREPRSGVKDRPNRLRLALRRWRRYLRPGLAAALVLALIGGGVVIAREAQGDSVVPLRARFGRMLDLKVTDIVVDGRHNTPEPLLRAALGVSRGEPILGFSVAAARSRIESLSWVDHASVERRLPGTVLVVLSERRAIAIWQHEGKFSLIDRDGQPVGSEDLAAFRDLPLVVGPGAQERAGELLDLLSQYPQIAKMVVAAVRVNQRRWNLHLTSGADVLLPEGHPAPALKQLATLEQEHGLLERPLAVIDLRLPDRLIVRPQAASPGGAQPGGDAAAMPGGPDAAGRRPT